jgi:hypothetical protein
MDVECYDSEVLAGVQKLLILILHSACIEVPPVDRPSLEALLGHCFHTLDRPLAGNFPLWKVMIKTIYFIPAISLCVALD